MTGAGPAVVVAGAERCVWCCVCLVWATREEGPHRSGQQEWQQQQQGHEVDGV